MPIIKKRESVDFMEMVQARVALESFFDYIESFQRRRLDLQRAAGPEIGGDIKPSKKPKTESTNLADPLSQFSWFVGEKTRDEAEDMLEECEDGTFLVRVSGNQTYVFGIIWRAAPRNAMFTHVKVQASAEPNYALCELDTFKTLEDLIEYYQKNSILFGKRFWSDAKGVTPRLVPIVPKVAPPPSLVEGKQKKSNKADQKKKVQKEKKPAGNKKSPTAPTKDDGNKMSVDGAPSDSVRPSIPSTPAVPPPREHRKPSVVPYEEPHFNPNAKTPAEPAKKKRSSNLSSSYIVPIEDQLKFQQLERDSGSSSAGLKRPSHIYEYEEMRRNSAVKGAHQQRKKSLADLLQHRSSSYDLARVASNLPAPPQRKSVFDLDPIPPPLVDH